MADCAGRGCCSTGYSQAYADVLGMDWASEPFEVRRLQREARLKFFARYGCVDAHGFVDYRRAELLGVYPWE